MSQMEISPLENKEKAQWLMTQKNEGGTGKTQWKEKQNKRIPQSKQRRKICSFEQKIEKERNQESLGDLWAIEEKSNICIITIIRKIKMLFFKKKKSSKTDQKKKKARNIKTERKIENVK